MKRDPISIIIGVVIALIITLFFVRAARAGEADTLSAQLNALNTEYTQLNAERAQYKKKAEELKWAAEQLAPKIAQVNAANAEFQRIADNYEQKVAVHNNRCAGTFEDEGFVQACNGEKDQLDAEKAHYESQRAEFQTTFDLLKQALQEHDSQVTLNAFADEKARNRQIELHDMAIPIIARLKEIADQNFECKKAINNADIETMHRVCGKMFDGNN